MHQLFSFPAWWCSCQSTYCGTWSMICVVSWARVQFSVTGCSPHFCWWNQTQQRDREWTECRRGRYPPLLLQYECACNGEDKSLKLAKLPCFGSGIPVGYWMCFQYHFNGVFNLCSQSLQIMVAWTCMLFCHCKCSFLHSVLKFHCFSGVWFWVRCEISPIDCRVSLFFSCNAMILKLQLGACKRAVWYTWLWSSKLVRRVDRICENLIFNFLDHFGRLLTGLIELTITAIIKTYGLGIVIFFP